MKTMLVASLVVLFGGVAGAEVQPSARYVCQRADYALVVEVTVDARNTPVDGQAVLSRAGATVATMQECELLPRPSGFDIPTVGRCSDAAGNTAQMSVGGVGGFVSASVVFQGETIEFTPADCRR
jgi:hypothetical protein